MMKKQTELTDSHQIAWARIFKASTRILQAAEDALKADGFPPLAWYDLLLELKRAGTQGLRPYQLQQEMLIPQYNMSRLIDRIAKAGYITRIACDDDARGQVICITESGLNLQKKMWPVYKGVLEREIAQNINESDAQSLADLLQPLATPRS